MSARKRKLPTGLWATLAIGLMALMVPACEDDVTPPAEETESSAPSEPHTRITVESQESISTDEPDPAGAPHALLIGDKLAGWRKAEPIRLANPAHLDQVIPEPAIRSVIENYGIRRAAHCAYQSGNTRATVLFIEATGSDDAFGLFSILAPQRSRIVRPDGSMRATQSSRAAETISGWQGVYYVELLAALEPNDPPEKTDKALTALFDRILFSLPAADPPFLLRAIPRDMQAKCHVWVVRRAAVALAMAEDDRLRTMNAEEIDMRLGLNGKVLLSVASVPIGTGGLSNLIWLAEYPDAATAAAAFQTYKQALQSSSDELDTHTIIDPPSGRYFFGTWSSAQESLQPALTFLRSILPATGTKPG